MVRKYALEYYKKLIIDTLGDKEMSFSELQQKVGLSRVALARWVDLLVLSGVLKERFEANKRMLSVNKG